MIEKNKIIDIYVEKYGDFGQMYSDARTNHGYQGLSFFRVFINPSDESVSLPFVFVPSKGRERILNTNLQTCYNMRSPQGLYMLNFPFQLIEDFNQSIQTKQGTTIIGGFQRQPSVPFVNINTMSCRVQQGEKFVQQEFS